MSGIAGRGRREPSPDSLKANSLPPMLHEADLPPQAAGFGRVVTEGAGTHASLGHLILVDEGWPLIERGVNPEIDLRDGASGGRSWPGTPSSRLLLWYLHRAVEDSIIRGGGDQRH